MSSRQPREAGGVLSFTFLDVLTCTMGSLVLLVVVLGERAADIRLEDALRNGPKRGDSANLTREGDLTGEGEAPAEPGERVPALGSAGASPSQPKLGDRVEMNSASNLTAAEAASQLESLRKQQKELASLRRKATERLDEETARVTHLEEHERRLERELAELHVTL